MRVAYFEDADTVLIDTERRAPQARVVALVLGSGVETALAIEPGTGVDLDPGRGRIATLWTDYVTSSDQAAPDVTVGAVWDLATGRRVAELDLGWNAYEQIAFDADGATWSWRPPARYCHRLAADGDQGVVDAPPPAELHARLAQSCQRWQEVTSGATCGAIRVTRTGTGLSIRNDRTGRVVRWK